MTVSEKLMGIAVILNLRACFLFMVHFACLQHEPLEGDDAVTLEAYHTLRVREE